MAAELLWRALANGAVLVAIVWVFRRRGQRAAGVLAALPLVSFPALFMLTIDQSPAVAAAAAVAGLHATGLAAALVLFYGAARRPFGNLPAMAFGVLAAWLFERFSHGVGHALPAALALTIGVVTMARSFLPALSSGGAVCRFLRGYLDGLLVRCGFLTVLGATLVPLGGWLAFPLAMGAGVVTLLVVTSRAQRGGGGAAVDGGSATTRAERS